MDLGEQMYGTREDDKRNSLNGYRLRLKATVEKT